MNILTFKEGRPSALGGQANRHKARSRVKAPGVGIAKSNDSVLAAALDINKSS